MRELAASDILTKPVFTEALKENKAGASTKQGRGIRTSALKGVRVPF